MFAGKNGVNIKVPATLITNMISEYFVYPCGPPVVLYLLKFATFTVL
jgi:hypothetical protein